MMINDVGLFRKFFEIGAFSFLNQKVDFSLPKVVLEVSFYLL